MGKQSPNKYENSSVNIFDYEIYTRKGEKINNLSIWGNANTKLSSTITYLNSAIFEKVRYL